jgi:hypothetical protein
MPFPQMHGFFAAAHSHLVADYVKQNFITWVKQTKKQRIKSEDIVVTPEIHGATLLVILSCSGRKTV